MHSTQKVFVLLVIFIGVISAANVGREARILPPIECTSHNDCAPGSCCVIHMDRYSYPTCQKQPEEGEFCHPKPTRELNTSRYYPDGLKLFIEDAYYTICPCSIGLSCDEMDAVCRDANEI